MDLQYPIYLLSLFTLALLTVGLAIYAWRRRATPGASALVWCALLCTWLSVAEGLMVISPTPEVATIWNNLRYASLAGLPVAWLAFVLQYTGRGEWLTRRRLALLLVVPIISQIAMWTNAWHGTWSTYVFLKTGAYMIYDQKASGEGPSFWVHAIYGYALLLVAVILTVRAAVRSFHLYREQAVALLLASLLPIGSNLLHVVHPIPELLVNPTPVGISLGCVALAWAVFRYRLLSIVPVARSALIDSMGDGMLVLDGQDRVLDANPALCHLVGPDPSRVVGWPLQEVLAGWPELLAACLQPDQASQGAEPGQAEVALHRSDGVHWLEVRVSALHDRGASLTGRLVVLRDVTARREAEDAVRQRADELEALRTTLTDITSELELSALLRAIVQRAVSLLKATGGELGLLDEASHEIVVFVSHNMGADYTGTRIALGEGAMGRVAQTGETLIIDDYRVWEGHSPQYASNYLHGGVTVPLRAGDRLTGTIGVIDADPKRRFGPAEVHLINLFADQAAIAIENARLYEQAQREIAERERAEAALLKSQEHLEERVEERTAELRESEARYRTLFDRVPVGLYRTTPGGETVDANLALVEMMGYPSREAYLAVDLAHLYVDGQDRVRWQALMERAGVVRDFETRLRRYDGSIIWVNDTARGVKGERGEVLYYEGSVEDVTERKQAAEELRRYREGLEELVEERTAKLRESEERYRTLFDGVPVALYRTTPTGQVLDANRTFVQMSGCPDRKTLLSLNTGRFYEEPEEQDRWRELMEQQGIVRDFETPLRRYDGTLITCKDTARAVKDERGQVLYYEGSLEDITQQKQFEEEIRRQKDYFEALFVNSPVAVMTADLEGVIVSWNPMAERLFGYSQQEAIGRHIDDLVAGDPAILEESRDYTQQLKETGRIQATSKRTRKDGSLVDVQVLALPVIVAGEEAGYIGIYYDIGELQQARREAEAANQAKSTFLANMSHELRTPLNAILGFSQLMDGDPNLSDEQQENLAIINRSGEHLLALINDVLEMSKIEAGRVTLQETSLDLYSLLDTLEEMFRLRAKEKRLTLSVWRAEDVPRYVVADEGKLRQVLSNLLGNAVKFTQEGGVTLRISVPSPALPSQEGRTTIRFEVEDTGPGISRNELDVVFEPFVQATSEGDLAPARAREGTGLGLSISRQFVRLMGGDVSVSSELGRGSRFEFDLSVGLTAPAEAKEIGPGRRVLGLEPSQLAADGRAFRLLVVEDKETNRWLLVKLLRALGFEVQEAANGQEALEAWERWQPHLIWMDMRMPVMDGHEATRQIKARRKGQFPVVIALTATAFEEDREQILLEGCDDFVRKPFRKNEIYAMLAKHLGVRFLHGEEPAPPAPAEPGGSADLLSGRDLAAMPAAWLADLQQATIKADLDLILRLVAQVREYDTALADGLTDLARNYEYNRILTLIEEAGGGR